MAYLADQQKSKSSATNSVAKTVEKQTFSQIQNKNAR